MGERLLAAPTGWTPLIALNPERRVNRLLLRQVRFHLAWAMVASHVYACLIAFYARVDLVGISGPVALYIWAHSLRLSESTAVVLVEEGEALLERAARLGLIRRPPAARANRPPRPALMTVAYERARRRVRARARSSRTRRARRAAGIRTGADPGEPGPSPAVLALDRRAA